MSKILCPCVECVHNDDSVCNADNVRLEWRNMATVNEGRIDMWICKEYELSDYAKKIKEDIANAFMQKDRK